MVVRWLLSVGTLGTFAAMAVHNVFGGRVSFARDAIAQWSVGALLAVVAALAGLVAGRWWGRWLGLAIGLATSIFGAWILAYQALGLPYWPGALVFLLGPVLLAALTGRTMFGRFDAPAGFTDEIHARVVRWAVIANLASLGVLMFENMLLVREFGRFPGTVTLSLAAMVGVIVGSVLLAARRTAGLLVIAVATALLVVSIGDVLIGKPSLAAFMLATAVTPGVVLSVAAAMLYAKPIATFLRSA